MKSHHNYFFIQILWYFFVYSVIQTRCFFFLEKKVADLYEQSSRRVSLPVGAYWNPCLIFNELFLKRTNCQGLV